jgi:hypothetical protein
MCRSSPPGEFFVNNALPVAQDIMKSPTTPNAPIFGGKTVVFGGDFRQVLPVVKYGGKADVLNMTMKHWNQWHKITLLTLTENMRIGRLNENPEAARKFGEYLLKLVYF